MAYFSKTTERITLPSNPDYWVEIRKRLTHADQMACNEAINEFLAEMAGQEVSIRGKLHITADEPILLSRMIVAWNLDDESGKVLPINTETVKELSITDSDAIIRRIRELNPRRTAEERKN